MPRKKTKKTSEKPKPKVEKVEKPEKDLEKEVSDLKERAERIEKELERVEAIEESLAQQELILAKKVADMNRFEEHLKKTVHKDEIEEMRDKLKKLDEHEDLFSENTRFIKELISEMDKVKESHRITRKHVLDKGQVSKKDCEQRFEGIREALQDLEHIRSTHKKKAGHNDLSLLRREVHDRLSQIEHQNKLLMHYLKKVDEILQKTY